ncbi:hypothetical protein F2Q69_00036666 [Brassica cretica]|uniref:Uncharacterized protein n=1 Tax=Brassica cretica TaxID=69181 RepID=A0A8S9SPD8_BRACR|nr:hypothetical protein F2Q69_00036666 [Brassica cretica]
MLGGFGRLFMVSSLSSCFSVVGFHSRSLRVLWFFAGMGVLLASYLLAGGCAFGALGMCLPTSC